MTLQDLAQALEQEIARNVQLYDLALSETMEGLSLPGLAGLDPQVRRVALFSRVATGRYMSSVLVLDENGAIRFDSASDPPRNGVFADRDFFQRPKQAHDGKLFISTPYHSRLTGSHNVAFSRALANPDGSFAGVVVGGVQLALFQDLFERLNVGRDGAVSLLRSDGIVLARWPNHRQVGHDLSRAATFQLLKHGDAGLIEGVATMDGITRIYAYRRVGDLPLIVAVGFGVDEVFAPARRRAVVIVLSFAGLLGIAGLLAAVLQQEILRRRDAERSLRDLADNLEHRVTEVLAESEAALRRAAFAERMQALGELAGGIAHDFNNVLQTVSICTEHIERGREDAANIRRFAGLIRQATTRGASITKRLLTFSRRDELRAELVPVPDLIENLREILSHTLPSTIDIRMQVAAGPFAVWTDKGQLETVLVNLATNARDAMPGGGALTLGADLEQVPPNRLPELAPGSYVRLWVADTGAGMDPETLARAMEPFFTTKAAGDGTGLGLSMAQSFAEHSNGTLAITSAPGQGTTVAIWLPLAATVPEDGAARNKSALELAAAPL